jgi:crotonobetainyl-CoA:carnitine CoA-transferase CaiB-like acyl-CoA transferase
MFKAMDGYVMVAAYFPDQWIKFCTALDATYLIDDPRYATNAHRIRNKEQLSKDLAPIFATRTRDEWAARLTEAGVISAPVLSQLEIVKDPGLRSLGRFKQIDGGDCESYWIPDLPYAVSGWTPEPLGQPPALGEHTREVLKESGCTDAEIAEMEAEGLFGTKLTEGW